VHNLVWCEWAEMSLEHRDTHDADVALILATCRHEGELDHLAADHRDLHSMWERA
jgi:hypothetical protein